MAAKYVIGIDLGTTNSVLAYAKISEPANINILGIPQLVGSHTVDVQSSLASFTYLANPAEAGNEALELPWTGARNYAVGHLARVRSAEAPERTVGAAKSWLCYGKVDRRAPILPWNAPADVQKISPLTAARFYLEHLVDAWHHQFPDARIEEQAVVLTVPASFDPVARELTREAALEAGFPADFLLLEEPQAALYAWLYQSGETWRKQLRVGESVLVCDVGGGTTDLTLIAVAEENGELILQREAVGEHLLVGGDNMDLTMAHVLAGKFAEQGTHLNPWQSVSLWHSCRAAKEKLLIDNGAPSQTISVLGRGSRLIGNSVSLEIQQTEVADLLLNGFFPECSLTDVPQRQMASGFQEIGLPYESDPAITRHVAAFVSAHGVQEDSIKLPNHVLFNGGVFKSTAFQHRMLQAMTNWNHQAGSSDEVRALAGLHDLDFAVARGACFYGWNKQSGGLRIRGGVANSYYVGIESAGLAIPGAPRPLKALCVVPFGMEEGSQIKVPSGDIGLVVGQPVQFRFFRSNTRKEDLPGTLLEYWAPHELLETDPLVATLNLDGSNERYVPVKFDSRITELGMFELWCVGVNTPGQWKLEFNVRDES